MTLDELELALYYNNLKILDKIKEIKDVIDGTSSADIDEIKTLIDNINNIELINIKQLIEDLDINLSNHTNDTVIHVTQNDKDLWNATLQNAKDYAKILFDGITSFTIEIVDVLPTENINTMTIYFMRNDRDNESDYYEEYMYINNKWEIIGSTFVNLAPYLLKEDFEKYQQEVSDKFLEYNTSDEITNILNNYLLTQTFTDTIKNYSTTEEINQILSQYAKTKDIHTHENKAIIDKLSESADGNLLFNGQEIKGGSSSDITISKEDNNAIQKKSDGIFVEDKSEQIEGIQSKINQLNIAQKTVNEVSSVSLLETPFSFTSTKATTNGTGLKTIINTTISLKEDITNFDSIEILLSPNNTLRKRPAQITKYRVNTIVYNNTTTIDYSNGSFIRIPFDVESSGTNNISYHFSLQIWFMDSKTVYIYAFLNPSASIDWTDFKIVDIIGIKDKFITIDPVEYVNTTNGIEDTPVGHIISHMGNNAPKHYLVCDGTEYNITDYPYLAQHFMDEFGSYNYFGGDGVDTFAVPDLRGEFLRGTGTNSHANCGNGSDVGKHQDATAHLYVRQDSSYGYIGGSYSTTGKAEPYNIDSSYGGLNYLSQGASNFSCGWNKNGGTYTSRPTNTSVLYCIKYEPTYYMNVMQTISLEEAEAIKKQNELLQEEINSLGEILDSINKVVV